MTDASLTADQPAKKKSSLVMTAAAVLGLTVVGVGGGWVVGKMIVPSPVVEEAPAAGHGAAADETQDQKYRSQPSHAIGPLVTNRKMTLTTTMGVSDATDRPMDSIISAKPGPDVAVNEGVPPKEPPMIWFTDAN